MKIKAIIANISGNQHLLRANTFQLPIELDKFGKSQSFLAILLTPHVINDVLIYLTTCHITNDLLPPHTMHDIFWIMTCHVIDEE